MDRELYLDTFKDLIDKLSSEIFQTPKIQSESDYFPDYLENKLSEYIEFYCDELKPILKKLVFGDAEINQIENIAHIFKDGLKQTVDYYYSGKIYEATSCIHKILNNHNFPSPNSGPNVILQENFNFFRARKHEEDRHFKNNDLFHISFESRHKVSSNRYSIPGFPALYLGDSCYVCWEEFDRYRLRNLWFSRISNQRELNVIQIEGVEHFLDHFEYINTAEELAWMDRTAPIYFYLITFPLTLSCTIKVKNPTGTFKPEYIIPQLLLQYVSQNPDIDGIRFPSSKIDYSKLKGFEGYNYVFPVKESAKSGYCKKLTETFYCTEPTSLEIEEIIYNKEYQVGMYIGGGSTSMKEIEIIDGEKISYDDTSFGRIERALAKKELKKIES